MGFLTEIPLRDQLWFIFFAVIFVGVILAILLSSIAAAIQRLPEEIERKRLHMSPSEYAEMESREWERRLQS